MKEKIQQATAPLIGMSLWTAGRAADLAWFHFGQRRLIKDYYGNPREVGEYALHLQCAWRIVQDETVLVASRDLYYPPGTTEPEFPPDFNWDVQGGNRLDERLKNFFLSATLYVVQIEAGCAGALRIFLGSGIVLEVFPDDSFDKEHWRLFRPYLNEAHFVVKGSSAGLD